MMLIFDLRSSKLRPAISIPSTMICPSYASKILSKDNIIVLFPLPVLPTTPILYPPWNVTVKPLNTRSRLGLYLTL